MIAGQRGIENSGFTFVFRLDQRSPRGVWTPVPNAERRYVPLCSWLVDLRDDSYQRGSVSSTLDLAGWRGMANPDFSSLERQNGDVPIDIASLRIARDQRRATVAVTLTRHGSGTALLDGYERTSQCR